MFDQPKNACQRKYGGHCNLVITHVHGTPAWPSMACDWTQRRKRGQKHKRLESNRNLRESEYKFHYQLSTIFVQKSTIFVQNWWLCILSTQNLFQNSLSHPCQVVEPQTSCRNSSKNSCSETSCRNQNSLSTIKYWFLQVDRISLVTLYSIVPTYKLLSG